MTVSRRSVLASASAIALVLALAGPGPLRVSTAAAEGLRTAPDEVGALPMLVMVKVNGVDEGLQSATVSAAGVTLPAATARALRIVSNGDGPLALGTAQGLPFTFDAATSSLSVTVPANRLGLLSIPNPADPGNLQLSEEAWGAYLNYDVNARHSITPDSGGADIGGSGVSGGGGARGTSWGGLFDLHAVGPDVAATMGWSHDGDATGQKTVRLDSWAAWQPASQELALRFGDAVGAASDSARQWRFGGMQIGSDHSAQPGWNSSPIPSVSGSAALPSSVDLYLNGLRTYGTSTSGGPFALALPPGVTGQGASVMVTDVTGKTTILPVNAPLINLDVLREGVFLWSAGAGQPRFDYGTASADYLSHPYGYASARRGITDNFTVSLHTEGGAGLCEFEAGANFAPTNRTTLSASVAASKWTGHGTGGSFTASAMTLLPWNLSLSGTLSAAQEPFADVVSASGAEFAGKYGISAANSQHPRSTASISLGWRASPTTQFSLSYQRAAYGSSPHTAYASAAQQMNQLPLGLASIGVSTTAFTSFPLFANAIYDTTGRGMTLIAGLSIPLGSDHRSSASAFVSSANGVHSADFAASHPLGPEPGSFGLTGSDQELGSAPYRDVAAQYRTGYGIPGAEVQSLGASAKAYASMSGAVGLADLHPFVSDPITSGLAVVDSGAPGVAVNTNGVPSGRTGWDGKTAIPLNMAGVSNRMEFDIAGLPMSVVPESTDGTAVIRNQGIARVRMHVRHDDSAASVSFLAGGNPPPMGSSVVIQGQPDVPVSKHGQAYIPAMPADGWLVLVTPSGQSCRVQSGFDGHGGPGVRLGPLKCDLAGGPAEAAEAPGKQKP